MTSPGSTSRRRSHAFLCAITLAYVASRVVGVLQFAPHNDEVNYADVVTRIAADWEANKYYFQDGRLVGEYKQPLQYWVDSLTVHLWADPLLGMRLWSLALGLCGLLFTARLVAAVWSDAAARVTAVLVVVSEYHLYFDSVALAEPFLYGLGAAYLWFLYDFLTRRRWPCLALATALLAAVLLTKISGRQWIAYGAVIPLLARASGTGPAASRPPGLAASYAFTAASALAAALLAAAFVPAEFAEVRARSHQHGFVHTPAELANLPLRAWAGSLLFYGYEVLWREFSLLLLPALAAVGYAGVHLFRRNRRAFRVFVALGLLWLVSFVPLVLLAKVRFIRYFGSGLYCFDALLGVSLVVVWGRLPPRPRSRALRAAAVALALGLLVAKLPATYAPLLRWGQTDLSLAETPKRWAVGTAVPELVERVAGLAPGLLIIDAQWGHPGTALDVYRFRYPQLAVQRFSPEWLDPARVRAELASGTRIYFAVDARRTGERPDVDALLASPVLCAERQVIEKRYRGRSLPGTALVLCEARP